MDEKNRFCPNCGKSILEKYRFCEWCGEKIEDYLPEHQRSDAAKSTPASDNQRTYATLPTRVPTKEKDNGLASMGCGVVLLAVGGIITWATYSAASGGGTYVVTTGLFIVGGIALLRGLWRWYESSNK
jgi:uncharacterized membrane protein YvbJ